MLLATVLRDERRVLVAERVARVVALRGVLEPALDAPLDSVRVERRLPRRVRGGGV